MAGLYPYVPIGNSARISIAIVSYTDTVSFGITADYDAVPDADVLIQGIRRGLAELAPPATRTNGPRSSGHPAPLATPQAKRYKQQRSNTAGATTGGPR